MNINFNIMKNNFTGNYVMPLHSQHDFKQRDVINNNNNNGRNGSCINVAGYLIRGEAQMAYN